MRFFWFVVLCLFMAFDAKGETRNLMEKDMDFDTCVETTNKTVYDLKAPYTIIVNTKIVYMVKIKVEDGNMLITCSKPDKKMTTTLTKGK